MTSHVSCKSLTSFSALLALALYHPVQAHHGFANHFDPDQERAIEGIVTQFEFVNPHVKIHLQVQNRDGETEAWVVETGGVSVFLRSGLMSSDTIKVGDHLRIVGHPARVKDHEMRANHITLSSGDELQLSNPYVPPSFLQEE